MFFVLYHRNSHQLRSRRHYPACACAARGKVIKFVFLSESFFRSKKKNLRWRELATSRTSERIRRFSKRSCLICTCHWADSLGISAVFLLSGPLCQQFYLRPTVTPTNYMPRVHLHPCPRPAITVWRMAKMTARGMCCIEL